MLPHQMRVHVHQPGHDICRFALSDNRADGIPSARTDIVADRRNCRGKCPAWTSTEWHEAGARLAGKLGTACTRSPDSNAKNELHVPPNRQYSEYAPKAMNPDSSLQFLWTGRQRK